MPVDPQELEPFVTRTGPVSIVHEDGSSVSYAASARLDMLDPERKDTWTVEHVQLTLLDEQAHPVRAIRGDHIVAVQEESVGYTVTVDASEERDPGDTVKTRGV
jgi:ABC-type microcin C transport system duplicated ATPase subunit YejF